jgi:hypothetical protein
MTYLCEFCKRTFATTYALKRHVSDKHQYEEVETSRSNPPHEDPDIWDVEPSRPRSNPPREEDIWDVEPSRSRSTPLYKEPGIWDVDPMMEDEPEPTPLEPIMEDPRLPEISDDDDYETEEDIDNNLTFPLSIDEEDYYGTSLDDAIKDKMHPPNTEWPNDIYREFMEIVMEFQLSNACGDRIIRLIDKSRQDENPLPKSTREGRKFLDINEFPYMKFKTVSITNFQDTDYKFYYQPIIHGIKVLLLQSDINREFVYKYRNSNTLRDRIYGEQFESDWWNVTERNIPIDNQLLSIIIYADSTTCDHLGKTSEHPIYISLGNIPNWLRNKPESKVLVGYLPKLKAKDNITKNSGSFRQLQRQVFQRCLRILLSPILNKSDMYFVVKGEICQFTPKISVILADLAEVATFTATYLPSTSRRPCCFCLIDNEDLNNMALINVTLRTPEKMKEAIDRNRANELSIHSDFNFFWKFDDFNIYSATVPDRMHLLDLGITKYLLEFTRMYLQQEVSGKAVKAMDHRLSAIPRYPGLIILKNGLENISRFTANDYRNIMKVIIFVIDNLYENYKKGGIPCERLCDMFYIYLDMYMRLRQESFTDMKLAELQVSEYKNF